MTSTPPPPPVTVTTPDGQTLRGHVHERRQVPDGWLYRVGIVLWQAPDPDHPEPGEYVAWMPATHITPVAGADYSAVPTTRLPQDIPPPAPPIRPPAPATAWSVERERRPYTETTARTVVHRSDCPTARPGPAIDTEAKARDAMAQPGARGCAVCGTDQSLAP
ncbi:DUF6233 domain-containing protein [Streptomyces sp. NBC_01174]|uniref:DUF6233 domain-containing protein n=1 Tax=Streptomyces sp. NBC_01174 TaxID=2903758 RepID=UPI002F915A6A|nr:DUF6233 domain-containing protein [Streptomyces sp. NBC_01174]